MRVFALLLSLARINALDVNWVEYGPKPLCETCEELHEQVDRFTKHGSLDELTTTFLCGLAEFDDDAHMKAVGEDRLVIIV